MKKSHILKLSFALLILIFSYRSIFQNSIYLYGEDATWINGFTTGDSYKSLFPRGSFFVLGVTLLHFLTHQLAATYTEFVHLKTLISLVSILLIAVTFFLNKFLPNPIRYLLFLTLALPITQDIQFEVYGHLHNLVWLFPIAIYNLSFFIWELIANNARGKRSAVKISLCILALSLGGFLFPLCSIINIVFSATLLCYLYILISTKASKGYIKYTSIVSLSATINILLNISLILNTKDRTASIIEQATKPELIDKFEFFGRQLLGLLAYLPSYSMGNIFLISLKCVFGLFVLSLYLRLALKCYMMYKRSGLNSNEWLDLMPLLYASIVPFLFLFILYYTRFEELANFLKNFNGDGYPNRYYISTTYLFSINACILSTSQYLTKQNLKNRCIQDGNILSNMTALILTSVIMIQLNTIFHETNPVNVINGELIDNIECYNKYIIVNGYPNSFKTKISYDHKWYNDFNSFCA